MQRFARKHFDKLRVAKLQNFENCGCQIPLITNCGFQIGGMSVPGGHSSFSFLWGAAGRAEPLNSNSEYGLTPMLFAIVLVQLFLPNYDPTFANTVLEAVRCYGVVQVAS